MSLFLRMCLIWLAPAWQCGCVRQPGAGYALGVLRIEPLRVSTLRA